MPNYMTRSQYDRHVVATRACEEKLNLARKKVGAAAEHGDLSENAEYEAAIEESGFLAGRYEELKSFLVGCEIIDPRNTVEGMVTVGKTVTIRNVESGDESTYHIVGNGTTRPDVGEVSFAAPLGGQLIGHAVDDEVELKLPGGTSKVKVLKIEYTPEDV